MTPQVTHISVKPTDSTATSHNTMTYVGNGTSQYITFDNVANPQYTIEEFLDNNCGGLTLEQVQSVLKEHYPENFI